MPWLLAANLVTWGLLLGWSWRSLVRSALKKRRARRREPDAFGRRGMVTLPHVPAEPIDITKLAGGLPTPEQLKQYRDRPDFKYAGFSGPHPSLAVACPTCLSPQAHYCNGADGRPTDRPHDDRRDAAAKSREGSAGTFDKVSRPTGCAWPRG